MGVSFPSVAGSEGVGIIQKIGEDVTAFKELDTVMLARPVQGIDFCFWLTGRHLERADRRVRGPSAPCPRRHSL